MSTRSRHDLGRSRARNLRRQQRRPQSFGPRNVQRLARRPRQRGVALVLVMTVVAILTIFLSEMLQANATAFHISVAQRDKLKAEYLAKSGLNLTRLLIAREPQIRGAVGVYYQLLLKRNPPQLNVWDFADMILAPFISQESAEDLGTGIDFSQMEGVGNTGGEVEILATPENSKINISNPLFLTGNQAKLSLAMQLFALMGGGQLESPYDSMFEQEDADGQFTTRLDIVSAIIDWWDYDEARTVFDPGAGTVTAAGSEDDVYRQFRDAYQVKNAPFDSLEELRMIRGISDDFWVNFVEPDPSDPRTRKVTIYGSGSVNVNQAPPAVLLARLCSYVPEQPLCQDTLQILAFVQLFDVARNMLQIAAFSRASDFLDFMSGRGDIYTRLQGFAGGSPLMAPLMAWTPLQIPADARKQVEKGLITAASIFTVQSSARVGRAEVKLSSVVNFHSKWTPPPPNPGKMPLLGVLHHYRVE